MIRNMSSRSDRNERGSSVALTKVPSQSVAAPVAAAAQQVDWPAKIPAAIAQRHITRVEETPTSAIQIVESADSFCEGGSLSVDVEKNLFEAFVEDDYAGKLHLTTLRNDESDIVGLVFWREVPEDEMREWINFDALSASISDLRGLINEGDGDGTIDEDTSSIDMRHRSSLVPVREESLHWLYQATSSRHVLSRHTRAARDVERRSREELIDGLTHRWIKIELLSVRRQFWGHRYGSLLLACALYEAWLLNNNRAILHVAGGYSNVPAVRLYSRFGFVSVPAGEGGIFNKPDRDLFVLGNIGAALQNLSWSDCLSNPEERPLIESTRNKKEEEGDAE